MSVSKSNPAAQSAAPAPKRFVFEARRAKAPPPEGLSWELQVAVFLAAVVLVISRRPDAVLNPQFFGEDGGIWFPEAYMLGWVSALTRPEHGYFQTLPKLVSAIALLVPFRFAPLLMNLVGITVQVLPVNMLLSTRCRNWAPLFVRSLMAILYVGLPNSFELNAAIVEGQWHLALLACLVVLGTVPPNVWWRMFDAGVILLSGVTGPFSLVLLCIAIVFWFLRRDRWRMIIVGIVGIGALIQLSAIVQSAAATRPRVGLGASPELFVRLLAGQVYLGALLGGSAFNNTHLSFRLLAAVAVLGTAVVVYCISKARPEWKLFLAFAFLIFAAGLRNPMMSMTIPQWKVLVDTPGIRYWFFPMVGFVWALVWCATTSGTRLIRILAGAALLLMLYGIGQDWVYPAYPDLGFQQYAAKFASAAPGTVVTIPIVPAGWTMRLTKHTPLCRSMPFGRIDEPSAGARVLNAADAAGWVAAKAPVERVSLFIDGKGVGSTRPSILRPDVDTLYPQFSMKDKGWGAVLDLSNVPPGRHEIEARASDAHGCDAEFDAVSVERVK
ncbi:MAG: hypothetical protein JO270_10875 [Acidobacteriaceae bacterium]|nr:hypothetical protein [Acidobacteriaceae bacterium]MBV8571357.1 hypothetical protein [Acidobacteriaceae bacterium]